jgi:hypothetical protein
MAASSEQRYRNLACRLGRGEDVDEEEIREVLACSGRGLADLRADVAKVAHRAHLVDNLQRASALEDEKDGVESEILALNTRINEMRAEMQKAIAAVAAPLSSLHTKAESLRNESAQLRRAENELRQGADPSIFAKLFPIQRRREELTKERIKHQEIVDRAKRWRYEFQMAQIPIEKRPHGAPSFGAYPKWHPWAGQPLSDSSFGSDFQPAKFRFTPKTLAASEANIRKAEEEAAEAQAWIDTDYAKEAASIEAKVAELTALLFAPEAVFTVA